MRICTAVFMSGLAFTVGLLCGLLIQLPAESLPASAFEGHHLARVRRVAQADPSTVWGPGEPADNHRNYPDNPDTQSNVISAGTVDKQSALRDYSDNRGEALAGESPGDNGYQVINREKSSHFGALNKYPSGISDSVVYVNPSGQKLVLNNNVNKSADGNHLTDARGPEVDLRKTVPVDAAEVAGQSEWELDSRHVLARGQNMRTGTGDGTRSKGDRVAYGVYWSKTVESRCPKGFTVEDHLKWKNKVGEGKFIKMIEGCGRMQNRLLTFNSLDKACARYRLNVDQIQGEIYSYYLSKLLGISNVPPSTLQLAHAGTDRWSLVSREMANAKWSEEKPVILSKWMDNLGPAYIPLEFRNLSTTFRARDVTTTSSDASFVNSKTGSSLCELLQWSDLIVFDYLTANLDRVVNNLFNLQWNDRMMSKPTHNLESSSNGQLVFLDNESGLFHGYRLLDKYSPYHESLLNSLCIFRESTISKIRTFVESGSIGDELQSLFEKSEPLHKYVPRIPVKNIKVLKTRMGDVLTQVQRCESLV